MFTGEANWPVCTSRPTVNMTILTMVGYNLVRDHADVFCTRTSFSRVTLSITTTNSCEESTQDKSFSVDSLKDAGLLILACKESGAGGSE